VFSNLFYNITYPHFWGNCDQCELSDKWQRCRITKEIAVQFVYQSYRKYINCKHTSMHASRHETANHVYTYIQALSGILFTGCWGQVDIVVILGLLSEDWRHLSTSCRLPTSSSRNWNSPTPFHCVEELVHRWQNDISNFTVKGLKTTSRYNYRYLVLSHH
jgi:hypothetical protein